MDPGIAAGYEVTDEYCDTGFGGVTGMNYFTGIELLKNLKMAIGVFRVIGYVIFTDLSLNSASMETVSAGTRRYFTIDRMRAVASGSGIGASAGTRCYRTLAFHKQMAHRPRGAPKTVAPGCFWGWSARESVCTTVPLQIYHFPRRDA